MDESPLFSRDGEVHVFAGSSVPVADLFDRLASGATTGDFLNDHPELSPIQVRTAVLFAQKALQVILGDPGRLRDSE